MKVLERLSQICKYMWWYMLKKKKKGFPLSSVGKESARNAGDPGSIPGLGRSPEEGNGNLLQYSCQRITWTEDPGRLQSMGKQESDTT